MPAKAPEKPHATPDAAKADPAPKATAKTADTPKRKDEPVDASYPAQNVTIDVDVETGYAHVTVKGVFDREACMALSKRFTRLALEVA